MCYYTKRPRTDIPFVRGRTSRELKLPAHGEECRQQALPWSIARGRMSACEIRVAVRADAHANPVLRGERHQRRIAALSARLGQQVELTARRRKRWPADVLVHHHAVPAVRLQRGGERFVSSRTKCEVVSRQMVHAHRGKGGE